MSDPDRLAKVMATAFWRQTRWDRASEDAREGCRKAAAAVVRAALEDMGVEEVLRKVEWSFWDSDQCEHCCPVCDYKNADGHHESCPLDVLLTRIKAAKE